MTFTADIYLRRGHGSWRVRKVCQSRDDAREQAARIAREHGAEVDKVRAAPARHYAHGINARG